MQNLTTQTFIFIVGVGAPAQLYSTYLSDLKKRMPQANILVLEWWSQPDFGIAALQSYLKDSDVILISHSAGSVIALQALMKQPASIKKMIMLDSHFLRSNQALPSVPRMLEIMLSHGSADVQRIVSDAYAPIIENNEVFNRALAFAIDWVNHSFDEACQALQNLPTHTALFIGFTNAAYQPLSDDEINSLSATWAKSHVQVKAFAINHFDLIDAKHAGTINQGIVDWLTE